MLQSPSTTLKHSVSEWGLPLHTHLGGGGGVKSPVHFHFLLHAKKGGEGVQIASKIAYVLNGRPQSTCTKNQIYGHYIC